MNAKFNNRLSEIENKLGLGNSPRVFIHRPAASSIDGKDHWKDHSGEIKKPKHFNPGDKIIVDNIKQKLNEVNLCQ